MGIRGQKSSAELAVVETGAISTERRQEPPSSLTPEQRMEWMDTVNALPADWIRDEARAMLEAYCRHAVQMRKIAQMIEDTEKCAEFDLMKYDKLLQMQEREGRAMSSLATRLRLSPQSTYDRTKANRKITTRKPWQS